ncbi:hypothetical protein RchiOBHm_Chr4g0436991 [Rosa chinensis]|uniref:Uncharacterized protein n=1 Tax=Rosa chinensis TaxID=74649 RepID=A0A2P6R273_ROSCH|nr:hypothetical protein RchiOBHm_Chr4g0436991 [Rosa chinensis]
MVVQEKTSQPLHNSCQRLNLAHKPFCSKFPRNYISKKQGAIWCMRLYLYFSIPVKS